MDARVCVSAGVLGGQRHLLGSQGLALEVVVTWVLGIERGSCAGAVCVLSHEAISPVPRFF